MLLLGEREVLDDTEDVDTTDELELWVTKLLVIEDSEEEGILSVDDA